MDLLMILTIGLILFIVISFLFVFISKNTGILNTHLDSIGKVLFSLVTEAEQILGSGTGQAKTALVVALFYERYPSLSRYVSSTLLTKLIEQAVVEMSDYIESNINMRKIIVGDENDIGVDVKGGY